jgi:2-oxoglutarate ferredoxin oxidoreductase subunit alpha
VMSSSSSPGVSLMMEGLSYIAGTEIPAVLVNVMRGGPGLGNIAPSQADYNQAAHGGGHGDYRNIVLAPASVQEAADLMSLSFDLAEKYRTICMMIMDGCIGQMMEPITLPEMRPIDRKDWEWATNGRMGKRERRVLTSIYLDPIEEEVTNLRLLDRWQHIQDAEVRFKDYFLEDAQFVILGFGTAGRVALSAVRAARQQGLKIGLLRPITVSPFPVKALEELLPQLSGILVVEMNAGQMLEDVRLVVRGRVPVEFYGRLGGVVPFPDEILGEIHRVLGEKAPSGASPREAWFNRMISGTHPVSGTNG